jgi:hypothetical protein
MPLGRRARAFHSRKHYHGALPMLAEETNKLFGNFGGCTIGQNAGFQPEFSDCLKAARVV